MSAPVARGSTRLAPGGRGGGVRARDVLEGFGISTRRNIDRTNTGRGRGRGHGRGQGQSRGRDNYSTRSDRRERFGAREKSGGQRGGGGEGVAWLADDVRELASEALRLAAADASASATARATTRVLRPFEGGDYTALLREIPGQHWAAPYLREVAATLEGNADISPNRKLAVLTETLNALRYADAEK